MLSWFSRNPKSQLPEPTALQQLRATQIGQLRLLDCGVAEIQRDVQYRITVSDALSLQLTLPPLFPQERPIVRVSPAVVHPWVSEQMIVVGCPAVNGFTTHSDLAKVIKEIVDEFRMNPPTIIGSASSGLYSAASNTAGVSAAPAIASRLPPPSRGAPSLNVADPNSASAATTSTTALDSFPGLAELSTGELRDLMEDEEKLLTFLQPQYQSISEDRINLLDALEVSASENIFKQAQLEERKRAVLERHYALNGLCRELDELLKRQDDVRQKYDLPLIQDNLKVASLEAEEKGEAFADQFLDGKLTVDEFRKNYMASRIQYHHRRAMEDKLAQLIGKQTKKF